MKQCAICGRAVSDNVSVCPGCGEGSWKPGAAATLRPVAAAVPPAAVQSEVASAPEAATPTENAIPRWSKRRAR